MIRCGASPESRTVVDPSLGGAWIEEWTAGGDYDVVEGSSEFAAGIAQLEIYGMSPVE